MLARPAGRDGPRRGTLAVLAVLVAVVCGAATIQVAAGRPAGSTVASSTGTPVVAGTDRSARPPTEASSGPTFDPVPTRQATTPGGDDALGAATATATEPATADSLEPDLVLLGSWTVGYVVGPENGQGVNIEIPLRHLDGRWLAPGAKLDFWDAVGEVSRRAGYRQGAMIVGDHVDPDGALAGGICTASTVLFDAAAQAGLQILSRTSHGGYLAKYPLGLDAAVAKGDGFRQTMAFRNDTSLPILIRTVSTPGIARVDLYARHALGRQVSFSAPVISERRRAHDRHLLTTALARGQHQRVAASSDGMTAWVTRTVRDASGRVVHRDHWRSVYRPLEGLVRDGTG